MLIGLIGARGSGKSTVGRALARRLAVPFVDLDAIALGRFPESSVRRVWQLRGESAWREAETAALSESLDLHEAVIALGGGTPMIDAARRLLGAQRDLARVFLVYLRCDPAVLAERLDDPGDRPSLTGDHPAREIAAVLAQREPVYRELADCEIAADRESPDELAAQITRILSSRRSGPGAMH